MPSVEAVSITDSHSHTGAAGGRVREIQQEAGTGILTFYTTNEVWGAWNASYALNAANDLIYTLYSTGTGAGTTINQTIWTAWNIAASSSVTSTMSGAGSSNLLSSIVWGAWGTNHEALTALRLEVGGASRYARKNLSEEEVRRELEREKRLRQEAEARAKAAQEAKTRAERLLRTCLSPEQQEDLTKKNCFYVLVPIGDGKVERYRIDRGISGNVKQLDEKGSVIRSFCVHPDGVPECDVLLAQKLFIEADEETRAKFWEAANITDLMPAKHIPSHIPRAQRRKYAVENGLLH